MRAYNKVDGKQKACYRVKFIRNHPFPCFKPLVPWFTCIISGTSHPCMCLIKTLKKKERREMKKGGKERLRERWNTPGASNKSSSLEQKLECNDTYNLLLSPFCGHYTYSCPPRIRRTLGISERERTNDWNAKRWSEVDGDEGRMAEG